MDEDSVKRLVEVIRTHKMPWAGPIDSPEMIAHIQREWEKVKHLPPEKLEGWEECVRWQFLAEVTMKGVAEQKNEHRSDCECDPCLTKHLKEGSR